MQKQAPSLGRILSMVVFAMSCFGLLLFLWLSFGGPVPLRPEAYRFTAVIPEAATLAQEADVRLAGVNVGRVKSKELQKSGKGTLVEIEVKPEYGPIPEDSRLMLRQKTLLGETYVEITQGSRDAKPLADGGRLTDVNVEDTVELDEIFQAFDKPTREAFQAWVRESAKAVQGGTGLDLNEALGNLDDFIVDGADVLGVLDKQDKALRQLIKNTGVTFRALSEREGELRSLIQNSGRTFEAFASRDAALEETFRIFPTFLDESRQTLARLENFSRRAQPVVEELQPVADDLTPTVKDVAALAPDLRRLFRDLDPLIDTSKKETPQVRRILRGASPVFDQLHPFLQELNPILAFANYDQVFLATFISHGGYALNASLPPLPGTSKRHYLRAWGAINGRSLSLNTTRPPHDRGLSYPSPTAYTRAETLGGVESFDCAPTNGEQREPIHPDRPVCWVQGPSLYDGKFFPRLERGVDKLVPAPGVDSFDGVTPALPSRR